MSKAPQRHIPCHLDPAHLVPVPAGLLAELLDELTHAASAALRDALAGKRHAMAGEAQRGKQRAEKLEEMHAAILTWMLRAAVHHGRVPAFRYPPHEEAAMGDAPDRAVVARLKEVKDLRNRLARLSMDLEAVLRARGLDPQSPEGAAGAP